MRTSLLDHVPATQPREGKARHRAGLVITSSMGHPPMLRYHLDEDLDDDDEDDEDDEDDLDDEDDEDEDTETWQVSVGLPFP